MVFEIEASTNLSDWEILASRSEEGTWSGEALIHEHIAPDGRLCVTGRDTETSADGDRRYLRLVIR